MLYIQRREQFTHERKIAATDQKVGQMCENEISSNQKKKKTKSNPFINQIEL